MARPAMVLFVGGGRDVVAPLENLDAAWAAFSKLIHIPNQCCASAEVRVSGPPTVRSQDSSESEGALGADAVDWAIWANSVFSGALPGRRRLHFRHHATKVALMKG